VVGAASLLLALQLASPVRADGTTVSAQSSTETAPLPSPGTYRLIRIGPQLVLREDARGTIILIDEPEEKPNRGGAARGAALVFGVLGGSAALLLGRNEFTSDVGGRAPR
jgi:hypothetical protein